MRRHTPRCPQSGGGKKPLMPESEQGTHSSISQFATHWPVFGRLGVRRLSPRRFHCQSAYRCAHIIG